MIGTNNRGIELLRPWRMMDRSSDETPIGEGHTIGEVVRDLFSNTNYLEVTRDEVAQSLREVGAGDAAARAEGALSMTELMLVAGEYREVVETYVERMYDGAHVNSIGGRCLRTEADLPSWIGSPESTTRASVKLKKAGDDNCGGMHSRIVSC